jgi:hypothetical protein
LPSRAGFESRLSGSNALVRSNGGTFFFQLKKSSIERKKVFTFGSKKRSLKNWFAGSLDLLKRLDFGE